MRTIVAGCRTATRYGELVKALDQLETRPTAVLSGTALGADRLGERWARENNIPIERYPADWDLFGKLAGRRRNVEMAENAEALVALWDGESRGTRHMIDVARKFGLAVTVWSI